jgi:hypothetical protein
LEAELNKELKRLQEKYKLGFEIELDFHPTPMFDRPTIVRADGRKLRVNGEWNNNTITIYEDENLDKALHVLRHEFIERMLLIDLVDPYVILSNSLQNVFSTLAYKSQEKKIELLAHLEDEEYERIKRNSHKN